MDIYQISRLQHGEVLHHRSLKNADGTPVRCQVTGKPKAYKRVPENVRVPVKYGMYDSFYLTKDNCDEWM
jgi:hypothetical protein